MNGKDMKGAVAIICGLIITCLVIGIFVKTGDKSNSVKENIQAAVSVVAKPVSNILGGIGDGLHGIFRFKSIVKENQQLEDQISKMEQERMNLRLEEEELQELRELSKTFRYNNIQHETLQAANIVSMDSSTWMNTFSLDQGSDSGIKTGDAVVAGDGLVGKVTEVSKNTAKVVSIIEDNSKVSFQVQRDKKLVGVAQGSGKDNLSGYLLDNSGDIKKGDTLITSGIGTYPKGLKLGTVTEVEKDTGTQFVRLKADTAVTFYKLKKVAVIL